MQTNNNTWNLCNTTYIKFGFWERILILFGVTLQLNLTVTLSEFNNEAISTDVKLNFLTMKKNNKFKKDNAGMDFIKSLFQRKRNYGVLDQMSNNQSYAPLNANDLAETINDLQHDKL